MARITDKGISGAIGPVVYYTVNGRNYIRSMPRKRKKKRGQPQNPLNTIFGMVSKYGSGMIKAMSKSFLFPFNLMTYNRLRGWMRDRYAAHKDDAIWELSGQSGMMCQVNPETDIRDFLGTGIAISDNGNGKIGITIPAINPVQSLRAPVRTRKVNMKLIAISSPFRETGFRFSICMEQYNFNYENVLIPAKEIILEPKTAAAGDIAIVVMAFEFETSQGFNKDDRWLPAAIVAMGRLKD